MSARFPLRAFMRNDSGATLVELAVVLPLFLLIFLGLIDFGRMGGEYVMAEKAMERAARIAAVRPPACVGVPLVNTRAPVALGTVPPRFGTGCAFDGGICQDPGTITCTGDATNPTVAEIWAATADILPVGAAPANLRFSYSFDPRLGFLGGPYVPVVTVALENLDFRFVTPIASLAGLAGADGSVLPGATIPFPRLSVSLPGEDLAAGENG
jgi:hypothetical protein